MLKKALLIACVACVSITHLSAQVISQWNFDSLTLSSVPGVIPVPTGGSLAADTGTGLASALHASVNTVYSTPAGNDSLKSLSSNNWAVGDYYQFQVSTVGFSNINIGFMQTSSNTGPSSFTLQYSLNGTTFTDLVTYSIPANPIVPPATTPTTISWSTTTYHPESTLYFDLSAITALNNAATVYFRLTDASTVSINAGTVAPTGTGRLDTFTVSQGPVDIAPIPEPGTVALIGIGLGAVLFGVRRRRA